MWQGWVPGSGLWRSAGIKERFGDDVHERLDREGQMQIVWPNSSNPDIDGNLTWTLTKEVHKASFLVLPQLMVCWPQ